MRVSFSSPFDYANQTRILVVNDLDRERPEATASAMAALMIAAGGGGLGLFTAIRRLRAVYPALASRLEAAEIPLYAQHIDQMNLQTLLAMFREDPESCLLGTDAVRDGIDVPGAALRLIVFDRMPWPTKRYSVFGPRQMAGARSLDRTPDTAETTPSLWTADPAKQ